MSVSTDDPMFATQQPWFQIQRMQAPLTGPSLSFGMDASQAINTQGLADASVANRVNIANQGAALGGGGGIGNWLGNGQNLNAVMQGIGALTGAWLGYQNLRVAKDQLSFQKDAFAKNYGSQVKSYNTSLEDRIRGRTADYTGKEADVQAYLSKHKLGG